MALWRCRKAYRLISFEFEAWAEIATEDPSQLALEELSLALQVCSQAFETINRVSENFQTGRLMQVSDTLSAHNCKELAGALAIRLKAADWRSAAAKEAMLRVLLSLGKKMQHLVFREAACLNTSIYAWPTILQQVRRSSYTLAAMHIHHTMVSVSCALYHQSNLHL